MTVSEETLRTLALKAISELGENATPDAVKKYIQQQISETLPPSTPNSGMRVILTAFGVNHPGIVSTISQKLSERSCDILDISQKIMQEFFTMIMLIDMSNCSSELKSLQEEMSAIAEKLKIKIYLQHEDVFRYMHRI